MEVLENYKIQKTIGKGEHYLINSVNIEFLNDYKEILQGKIDLISIDPPYNTGKKMGKYKDNFGSIDEWLKFIEPRLILSKIFLSDEGLIFININDINMPYLRMSCDNIFGIKNYISSIVWQNKYSVSNDKHGITCQTEY